MNLQIECVANAFIEREGELLISIAAISFTKSCIHTPLRIYVALRAVWKNGFHDAGSLHEILVAFITDFFVFDDGDDTT